MIKDLTEQTIVAPATAVGEGGIGIIRLSGTSAESFLQRFFSPSRKTAVLESHYLYHGHVADGSGHIVDEVMAVLMRSPRSYTGEDVAEIHCHGGPLIIRRILDLFLEAGARLAAPGEFTLRAFLNGRLDLSQAEAVIDVIRSRSEAASQLAVRQMEGALSRIIYQLRDRLLQQLSLLEAHIDFPEEDIDPPALAQLEADIQGVGSEIDRLLDGFDSGRVLREGLDVLILGRPNVGKSSLLNALLGEARAIVTDIPGTTRDTVEESLEIGGIPIHLVDTAGVHATDDPVESEGVRRASRKCETADLILLVIDTSQPVQDDDRLAYKLAENRKTLLVLNKSDCDQVELEGPFSALPAVAVSAKTGSGLDELKHRITEMFLADGEVSESTLLSDRRHREALLRARDALTRFEQAFRCSHDTEFLAFELNESLQALGEITGETTPDDVLEQIFTRFCIGK